VTASAPARTGTPLENVPNGIAYDAEPDAGHGHLFVTGKRWPKVFELALDPLPPPH